MVRYGETRGDAMDVAQPLRRLGVPPATGDRAVLTGGAVA
jgi:hypothetical protein